MLVSSDSPPAFNRRSQEVTATTVPARQLPIALALMGLSGFAALGYQMIWTQQLGIWLGHDMAAVLAVVTAFFLGLSGGAWLLQGPIGRSVAPWRWYAGCEAVIALWALVLSIGLGPANAWLAQWMGPTPAPLLHWSLAFLATLLLLLPATLAMGATLPAMERLLGWLPSRGFAIGALYGANTLGAVAGVLVCALVLVPAWGLGCTTLACAALSTVCAVLVWPAFRARGVADPVTVHAGLLTAPGLAGALAATGLLGIGFEVTVVRVLSQVTQNTVYTFAMVLAVYLTGTAIGGFAWQLWHDPSADPLRRRRLLLVLLAGACLLSAAALSASPALATALAASLPATPAGAMSAEAGLAALVFALPAMLMGACFSHLAVEARVRGLGLGPALAINTLGGAIAPPLFGVVVLPLAGPLAALGLLSAGYLALSGAARRGAWPLWLGAIGLTLAAFALPPLRLVDVPEDGRLAFHREGVGASVSVTEDASGVRRLRINNREQEGSSATFVADARMAYLPLLMHPAPRNALFLGLGTGVTAHAATELDGVQVTVAELLPEVVAASALFRPTADEAATPVPQIVVADARRFVRAGGAAYDVVVADLFHPARSGAGALFTREHFEAIGARLAPDGVFCQWLPLHQLDLDTLASIVAAFRGAFPEAVAILATHSLDTPVLGLVAGGSLRSGDTAAVTRRLATARQDRLSLLRLDDPFTVLGTLVADAPALARFATAATPNTDDLPVVAHRAPRLAYAPDSTPRQRLGALLDRLEVRDVPAPQEASGTPADRLARYRQARNRFLRTGMDVQPVPDPRVMADRLRAPLLDIVRLSPEFRPAYDPLLRIASALAPLDPEAADTLLRDLEQANPGRPEAARQRAALAAARRGAANP